mmetsp:Transcript_1482/g.3252  ORF Transcript_1482/g.3252 Transcript_1482/m.3252 type:complete len:239 (+) Transcript_1482:1084-1800(+)
MHNVPYGHVHCVLLELPRRHDLASLHVCMVQGVCVVGCEQVHAPLALGQQHLGGREVRSALASRGEGEGDALVLNASLNVAQHVKFGSSPHQVVVLARTHDEAQDGVLLAPRVFLGTPLLQVRRRGGLLGLRFQVHGGHCLLCICSVEKHASVVRSQLLGPALLTILHAICVVVHLVVQLLAKAPVLLLAGEAQGPHCALCTEGDTPLAQVQHVAQVLVNMHINVPSLHLHEPVMLGP